MVISLAEAKEYLNYDDGDLDDAIINSFIQAAINYVENYTNYALEPNDLTVYTGDCGTVEVFTYPFSVTTADVKVNRQVLSSVLHYKRNSEISLSVGYADATKIPPMLILACKKVMLYMYENRDMYPVSMPTDVQYFINKLRRSPTI